MPMIFSCATHQRDIKVIIQQVFRSSPGTLAACGPHVTRLGERRKRCVSLQRALHRIVLCYSALNQQTTRRPTGGIVESHRTALCTEIISPVAPLHTVRRVPARGLLSTSVLALVIYTLSSSVSG